MPKIIIDRERCKGCFLCISFCPKNLIAVDKKLNKKGVQPVKFSREQQNLNKLPSGIPRLGGGKDNSECLGCSLCAIICPDCCITVYK